MADWAGKRVDLALIPPGQPWWPNRVVPRAESTTHDFCLYVLYGRMPRHARMAPGAFLASRSQ